MKKKNNKPPFFLHLWSKWKNVLYYKFKLSSQQWQASLLLIWYTIDTVIHIATHTHMHTPFRHPKYILVFTPVIRYIIRETGHDWESNISPVQ